MPLIDTHAHIFCWGEDPQEGFLSRRTQRSWLTRLILRLTGLRSEPGETLSEKILNRTLRQIDESCFDAVVLLAQDAVYHASGSRDDSRTHFYVSNDYVLDLAERHEGVIAGCSINPLRHDALQELDRCYARGARLIKMHTAIQGVDPALPQFDPFYRRAAELGVVLMFHTGYEHSCTVISQKMTDPARLERPLGFGGTVIAAHCGTCAFFDRESYYPNFITMMQRHPNLFGDTAVLASLVRFNALKKLSSESDDIRARILHGSDYPLPPSRLPYLARIGLRPPEAANPLDLDLRIKESYGLGRTCATRIAELLGMEDAASVMQ